MILFADADGATKFADLAQLESSLAELMQRKIDFFFQYVFENKIFFQWIISSIQKWHRTNLR